MRLPAYRPTAPQPVLPVPVPGAGMAVPPATAIPTVIVAPRANLDAPAIATRRPLPRIKEEVALISKPSADTAIPGAGPVTSTVRSTGHLHLR